MRIGKSAYYLAAVALSASAAFAQAPGKTGRIYDPATETTLRGTVQQVTNPSRGRMSGTHLFVKTENATVEVALGPSSFVTGKGFSFAKGDSVEVTGSKVTVSGKEYVIAREVVKDGKTLTLRSKDGIPEWAGQGGRWRRSG